MNAEYRSCAISVTSIILLLFQSLMLHAEEEGSAVKKGRAFNGSVHFLIEKLSSGVFAAIHRDGGGAICNAGIIDLGDRTLIFDTFLTPQAAHDLMAAAETLTQSPVTLVVNSHCHNDHIWGNQVFATQSEILSTRTTRELIVAQGKKQIEWYRENTPKQLASLKERYESAREEEQKSELSLWIDYYGYLAEALPALEMVPPNVTFSGRMEMHGCARTAELIEYENGHTRSDLILFLPQDSIIFMGDLLFVGCHPYLGDGDPAALVSILEDIRGMAASIFVPGHGPVGSASDLGVLIDYVGICRNIVSRVVDESRGEEALDAIEIPELFADWQQSGFFRSNLRFLREHAIK
ncbi:MAG: MBL fold metallo-hydrolase [candidate division WOR-3 bacterium]|jgi:glyoxylase-like metal-dependent hydrolase (beta-lactamase superfamily II)